MHIAVLDWRHGRIRGWNKVHLAQARAFDRISRLSAAAAAAKASVGAPFITPVSCREGCHIPPEGDVKVIPMEFYIF